MCQFNLIFVNNKINKEILENNEYRYWGNTINGSFPYFKGHCNCGSFVGSMCDYNGTDYHEMITSVNKEQLQRLNKIRDFMHKPGYKELRQNYINERDLLSNALEEIFQSFSDYEHQQINILEKNYTGKELDKHMENLYIKLNTQIENSPEYKKAEAKLNEFIENNELMEESTYYYLTKEEEDVQCKFIPADQFLAQNGIVENIDINAESITLPDEDSLVIDNVIHRLENQYDNNYIEFQNYQHLFKKLLENEDYILFLCIWDKPDKTCIKSEININDLKIEDLALLDYSKALKIYK